MGEDRKFLSKRQWRTVEKFADVFVEGQDEAIPPAEIAANIDRQLASIKSNRTSSLKLVLFLIEYGIPLLSLKFGFSRLDREARRTLIEKHLGPQATGTLRQLAKVRALFLMGYYGDPRVHPGLGFVPVPDRPRNQPPNELLPLGLPPLKLGIPAAGEDEIRADVCVIGSGAGGAVVAAAAAAEGLRVVVLEEGPYLRGPDMVHDEAVMVPRLYKEGGLQTTVDLNLSILQGKCLGGTTTLNNAICFRLQDEDLNDGLNAGLVGDWRRRFGTEIDRAALDESFDRVGDRLRIERIGEDISGSNASILLDGWKRFVESGRGDASFRHDLFKKNLNQCGACGYCNFGCPYERKLSTLETYLVDAAEAGARIIPECHAVKIRKSGNRAESVESELGDGRKLGVCADKIVLACGAIGSSVLLMKSGITKNVGLNFSFNVATPVAARFPESINGFDAVQMAAYVDCGDFLLESLFNPPMTFAIALPGWFERHFERVKAYDRFTSAGVVIGTNGEARVNRFGLTRKLFGPVSYELSEDDLRRLKKGIATLAAVYFAAGAEAVYPATFVDHEMKREEYAPGGRVKLDLITSAVNRWIGEAGDLTLNSSHPQGGNAMGDRERGVIDNRFRVHGFENLFVADASVFPTTIHVNPQWTIMAMADYAWRTGIRGEGNA